jgi:dTDP-4-amino-4,6-dideoxygalactose transaminase
MFSRNRLDIAWSDLLAGVGFSIFGSWTDQKQMDIETSWHPGGLIFSTLRASWDALLTELDLPKGTEVLCSAVNIPDMFQILEDHGLVAVPIELNLRTMAVDQKEWQQRMSSRTGLILISHLLGSRNQMDAFFSLAAEHDIPVVEDCAQAFDGHDYCGDQRALASLFSFGPIKTKSTLGGAVGIIRDPVLRQRIRARCQTYPRQGRYGFLIKVCKYGVMKLLTVRPLYALFVRVCSWMGGSHDQVINSAVLGLKGDDYYRVLRTQPADPMLCLMKRRLERSEHPSLEARRQSGEALLALLPADAPVLGRDADERSWWQFCVLSPDPRALILHLQSNGFDATDGSSRLAPVAPPNGYPSVDHTAQAMKSVVYVPAYAELGERYRNQLAEALKEVPDLMEWPPVTSTAQHTTSSDGESQVRLNE